MRRRTPLAAVLLTFAACGGTTVDRTGGIEADPSRGAGGRAAAGAGDHASTGAAGSQGAGGVASGSGGAFADGCFDDGASPRPSAKRCLIGTDCEVVVLPACCGVDRAVAFARAAACSAPVVECPPVDCVKSSGVRTEDGLTTGDGGVLIMRCDPDSDAGGRVCKTAFLKGPFPDR